MFSTISRNSLLLFSLVAVGTACSTDYPSDVSGVITLDSVPVRKGVVSFHPVDGGPIALATVGESGSYELKTGKANGLRVGSYQVTVNAVERPPSPGMTNSQIDALRITPARYADPATSGFTLEVKPGANEFNIELTSSPASPSL